MGTVYVAYNEALDVDVVVKVLRPDLPSEWGISLAHRLVQEARAAARLGHPAIVRALDFGETADGSPYLVMEHLAGVDLGTELGRRGIISPIKAVRFLLPIAHGLAAAHTKNIIHRDIKPENIFLAETDAGRVQPKLIDFGVAKLDQDHLDERITAVGSLLGSPGYMSPEQARGEDAGPAADIWSLCVVLHEMVIGSLPFRGDNYNALMRSIIEDELLPLRDCLPDEPELADILERGLAKAPEQRWASMRELGAELAHWLLERDVTEDVCGTALDTTWLDDRPAKKAYDAFGSIPPPSALRASQRISTPPKLEELVAPPPKSRRPVQVGRPAIRPPAAPPRPADLDEPVDPLPVIPPPALLMRGVDPPSERTPAADPSSEAAPSGGATAPPAVQDDPPAPKERPPRPVEPAAGLLVPPPPASRPSVTGLLTGVVRPVRAQRSISTRTGLGIGVGVVLLVVGAVYVLTRATASPDQQPFIDGGAATPGASEDSDRAEPVVTKPPEPVAEPEPGEVGARSPDAPAAPSPRGAQDRPVQIDRPAARPAAASPQDLPWDLATEPSHAPAARPQDRRPPQRSSDELYGRQ